MMIRPTRSPPEIRPLACHAGETAMTTPTPTIDMAADATSHFWAKSMFTGCFGINRFGVMEADPLVVQSQTRMLRRCEQLVVMADSTKLRQRSSIIVAGLERVTTLVTDAAATDAELEPLRSAGVQVIRVSVEALDRLDEAG